MIRTFRFRDHHSATTFRNEAEKIFQSFIEQIPHSVVKLDNVQVRVEWNFPEGMKFWNLSVNRKLLVLYAQYEFKTEIYFLN